MAMTHEPHPGDVDLRAEQALPDEERSEPPAEKGGWLRRNALAVTCLSIFLVLLLAQSLTGWRTSNADLEAHGRPTESWVSYLGSGGFAEATFENWESEFLQMAALVVLTVFLVQKGSPESKKPDDERDEDPFLHRHDPGPPWPVRRGGLWLWLYENSLLIAFTLLFLGSIIGHAVGGAAEFNAEQRLHDGAAISVWHFATTSRFWFESFQNWQSEFLAVFAIVVLTIFLRQKGSSQSKPVWAPNARTGD